MSKESNFSNDEQYVFAVVMITYGTISDSMGVEPIGMYSSLKKALKCVKELESSVVNRPSVTMPQEEILFDIFEFRLDEEPIILSMLKKKKDQFEKQVEDTIIKLMKKGVLDQLVGEDGNFYYTLTEKGEKRIKGMNLPRHISKLFKKKND